MKYVLGSQNKYLKAFRKELPFDNLAIDRVKRCDVLELREVILAHYEINPFSKKEVKNLLIRGLDFEKFINHADEYFIRDLFRRSVIAKEVNYWGEGPLLLEPVRKEDYVQWAVKKGLQLPECLAAEIQKVEIPRLGIVSDVEQIDFNGLSLPVLASLASNAIAQVSRRKNPKIKISEVYKLPIMQKFFDILAKIEDKDPKAEDTFREYVEEQFKIPS